MKAIVFALRGCPAGWLGAYGNDWVGTPNLDRLAAEGVTFDRHISDCPEPTAARAAWVGRPNPPTPFPKREEGEREPPFFPPPLGEGPGVETSLLTVLVRANHPDTDGPDWFYAGWDEVFDARPQADDPSPLDELLSALPALLDRLAEVPRFLLWVETDRLVPPWDVPQEVFEAYLLDEDEEPPSPGGEEDEEEDATDAEVGDAGEPDEDGTEVDEAEEGQEEVAPGSALRAPRAALPEEPVTPWADPPTGPFDRADLDAWDWLHRSFAAVVTTLDAELGRLFDDLRARGLDQSATWVVTSDYGHPLGEHGQIGLHRPWLHEELVHLPLVVRLPGAEQAGRRVYAFTQPPDLVPTLLALFALTPPAALPGFNLLPLARGEVDRVREFACTALELGDAAEISIRTDDWALLVPTRLPEGDPPREPQLYQKPDDRWEVNDLRTRNLERADELDAKLREEIQKREAATDQHR
jgi:arylsulfatase A-like enzyme